MGREAEDRGEEAKEEFKMLVFANDPGLYQQLFNTETAEPIEGDIEWKIPESPEELERLLADIDAAEAEQ